MFLTGPGVVERGDGRGRDADAARRPARARAQRRVPLRRAPTTGAALPGPRAARPICRSTPDAAPPIAPPDRRWAATRRPGVPADAAQASTTSATVDPRASSTAASCSRSRRAGHATWSPAFARIDGRTGRRRRQPAALPRRGDRRRRGRRRPRASSASATRSASRCVVLVDTPGFMPGDQAGVGRA